MNVLWESGPANVQTVQSLIQGRNLAYTTVQTMSSMCLATARARSKRRLKDRAYLYQPDPQPPEPPVTQAVGDMLDRFFAGSADSLVLSLVETRHLTPEKLARIQELIARRFGSIQMETISRPVLTFLLNALWQIPLAALLAAAVCRALRTGPAIHRHAVWVVTLALAILLPLSSLRPQSASESLSFDPSLAASTTVTNPGDVARSTAAPAAATASSTRNISITDTAATTLLGAYLLFLLYRIAMLARAALRTLRIRRSAHAATIPAEMQRVLDRCQVDAFEFYGVQLLFSPEVPGPVTLGRTIILPESLLDATSEALLPHGHWTRNGAHRAPRFREQCVLRNRPAADPLPSSHTADPARDRTHARNGVRRVRHREATRLRDVRPLHHDLRHFDVRAAPPRLYTRRVRRRHPGRTHTPARDAAGRQLEARPNAPGQRTRRARTLRRRGTSTLALTARAQSAAALLMQQGEAALRSGNGKQAIELYQSAVKLEPSNLTAKLRLADCLVAQYVPGTDPDNPYVTRSRQQLSDMLAIDPRNKEAIQGMMIVSTLTKQFAEAHDWAVRGIAADATHKNFYSTAGFADWSLTYPEYMAARAAAGMKLPVGIIPDSALRQRVLAQHGAQLDDGFRTNCERPCRNSTLYWRTSPTRWHTSTCSIGLKPLSPIRRSGHKEYTAKADDYVGQALAAKRKAATPRQSASPTQSSPSRHAFRAAPATAAATAAWWRNCAESNQDQWQYICKVRSSSANLRRFIRPQHDRQGLPARSNWQSSSAKTARSMT